MCQTLKRAVRHSTPTGHVDLVWVISEVGDAFDECGLTDVSQGRYGAPAVSIGQDSCRCNARLSPLHPPLPCWSKAMKIGIIGAGQIGGTLTRRLADFRNEVFVANSRVPENLRFGICAKSKSSLNPTASCEIVFALHRAPSPKIAEPEGRKV